MDIYVTGKIKNNVMYYAAYNTETGYIQGKVQATDKVEGQLYCVGAALINMLERRKEPYVNIHTNFESAVKYANGTYKPAGDVSKRFVKKIKSLAKVNGCEFSFDTDLAEARADKLYELAYSTDKSQKIEKPLAKKKKEIQPNRLYQNWTKTADLSDSDNLSAEDKMEQEMWDSYFEQERLKRLKEEKPKPKQEEPKEVVPYKDTYENYLNVLAGKIVEYDSNDFEWKTTSYDKDGNVVFELADRPYPGQLIDGVIVSENDWLKAIWQSCYNEQVKGYTVKREGMIGNNPFDSDRYKYFFIFGKDGNTLGMLSSNRQNLSLEKKKGDSYNHFYYGKIELDFSKIERSAVDKFAYADFEEAERLFNEFFNTINDDCMSYIKAFYEKNKEKQELEEKEKKETKTEVEEQEAEQENEKFEIVSGNIDQMTLFDL